MHQPSRLLDFLSIRLMFPFQGTILIANWHLFYKKIIWRIRIFVLNNWTTWLQEFSLHFAGHTYLNKIAWLLIACIGAIIYYIVSFMLKIVNWLKFLIVKGFDVKTFYNLMINTIINSSRFSIFRGTPISDCSFAPDGRDLSAPIPHTSRCPLNPGPTHATGGYQHRHHDQPPTPGVPHRQCGHGTDVQPLWVPLLPPAGRYSRRVPHVYWTDGSRYVKFLRCAVNVD